ncbi:MAG TPA: PilZ domain-containing protein [Pyrinomonadaceae bacterium]|nr:PilZ domain-containing protein [Pyrinomonadaceae bacterium]
MQKNSQGDEKTRRLRERIGLKIPVRVHGRDSVDDEWTEMSRLVDVTAFGARLSLKRPTERGRLLHLTLAMPQKLRCFDHIEDQYRVWSLVRNVKLLDPGAGALVEIGVAFVGKRAPRSFESDPSRRYEIAPSKAGSGLWSVEEESDEVISEVPVTDQRKESRHTIPIDVLIEVFGANGEISQSERTVTENISRQGAAVFTTLEVTPGHFVKVTSAQYATTRLAAVRGRRAGPDGIPRLHLEFVGSVWPLEGLEPV